MNRDDAQQLLGLLSDEVKNPDAVRRAWAYAIRDAHPDNGGDAGAAAQRIKELTKARDSLLSASKEANNACKLCRGVGSVQGVMGRRTCGACNGTGERQ